MKRLVWMVVAVTALIPPLTATAQEIDLETAVAFALESNLGIESELAEVRQKKLIADTWWNRFYPTASATVTLGRNNTESESTGLVPVSNSFDPATGAFDEVALQTQEQPRWFMSAGVDLSLVLSMQMVPGISLSRLDYENGLISLTEARAQVERDVSKQFYDL
ncbi:MAG: TolC family protein, partial [Alkalispirochaeta sp.]